MPTCAKCVRVSFNEVHAQTVHGYAENTELDYRFSTFANTYSAAKTATVGLVMWCGWLEVWCVCVYDFKFVQPMQRFNRLHLFFFCWPVKYI